MIKVVRYPALVQVQQNQQKHGGDVKWSLYMLKHLDGGWTMGS